MAGGDQLSSNLMSDHEKNSKRGHNKISVLIFHKVTISVRIFCKVTISVRNIANPLTDFVKHDHLSISVQSQVKNLAMVEIPRTIQEALDSPQWKQAIQEKMRALEKNQAWEVVQKPRNKVPTGCRWVSR